MEFIITSVSNLLLFIMTILFIFYILSCIFKMRGNDNTIIKKIAGMDWRKHILRLCRLSFAGVGVVLFLTVRNGDLYETFASLLVKAVFVVFLCLAFAAQEFILAVIQNNKMKKIWRLQEEEDSKRDDCIEKSENEILRQFGEILELGRNVSVICETMEKFEVSFKDSAERFANDSNRRKFEESIKKFNEKINAQDVGKTVGENINMLKLIAVGSGNTDALLKKLENFSLTHGKENYDTAAAELTRFAKDIRSINDAYAQTIGALNNNNNIMNIYEALYTWNTRYEGYIRSIRDEYIRYTGEADENVKSMVDLHNSAIGETAKEFSANEGASSRAFASAANALELLLLYHPKNETIADYWGRGSEWKVLRGKFGEDIAYIRRTMDQVKKQDPRLVSQLKAQLILEKEEYDRIISELNIQIEDQSKNFDGEREEYKKTITKLESQQNKPADLNLEKKELFYLPGQYPADWFSQIQKLQHIIAYAIVNKITIEPKSDPQANTETKKSKNDNYFNEEKYTEPADAKGQFELGLRYKNGDGVEKNIRKAVELFRKAAAQGEKKAQDELEILKKNINENIIDKSKK